MNRPQTAEDQAHAAALVRHAKRRPKTPMQEYKVVTYYHVTPERNVRSIRQRGLLIAYSQGRIPAIWLCTRTLIPWAVRHTQQRYNTADVVVLTVRVRRRDLIRFGHGRWFTQEDIGPENVSV